MSVGVVSRRLQRDGTARLEIDVRVYVRRCVGGPVWMRSRRVRIDRLAREVERLRAENVRLSRLLELRGQDTGPAPRASCGSGAGVGDDGLAGGGQAGPVRRPVPGPHEFTPYGGRTRRTGRRGVDAGGGRWVAQGHGPPPRQPSSAPPPRSSRSHAVRVAYSVTLSGSAVLAPIASANREAMCNGVVCRTQSRASTVDIKQDALIRADSGLDQLCAARDSNPEPAD